MFVNNGKARGILRWRSPQWRNSPYCARASSLSRLQ